MKANTPPIVSVVPPGTPLNASVRRSVEVNANRRSVEAGNNSSSRRSVEASSLARSADARDSPSLRRRSASFEEIPRYSNSEFLSNCFFMADEYSIPPADGKDDGITNDFRVLFFSVGSVPVETQINVIRAVKALTDLAQAFSKDPVDVVAFDNYRVACAQLGSLRLCLFGPINEPISSLRQRLRNLVLSFRLLHGSFKLVKRMLFRKREDLPPSETRRDLVSCFHDIGTELLSMSSPSNNFFSNRSVVPGVNPGAKGVDKIFLPIPYSMMSVPNSAVGSIPRSTGFTRNNRTIGEKVIAGTAH